MGTVDTAQDGPGTAAADDPEVVLLVERAARDRDAGAFGALYDLYVDRIYRYLYFRTDRQADAEDLTELVFLKAWEAIARFRWQGRPFLAWLYRLAHNAHIDSIRKQRDTVALDDVERPGDLIDHSSTAELAQRLDAQVLANAISVLTPDQQQVIVLKFIEGADNTQIAAIMDKREGAIRALQLRALGSLRRVLEAQGEGGSR